MATNNSTDTGVNRDVAKALFGSFAALSVVGNTLVCLVFLTNQQLLRQSSSIFIFSLALIDTLTGIVILVTPRTLYEDTFIHPHGIQGILFCRIISSEFFIWGFGIISVHYIAALSFERLYMVIRPTAYKIVFTRNRTILAIILLSLWGAILNVVNLIQSQYDKNMDPPCVWRSFNVSVEINRLIYFMLFLFKFALPCTITCICYTMLTLKVRKIMPLKTSNQDINETNDHLRRKVTRMSIVAAIAFFMCWLPNQIYFTLTSFQFVVRHSATHFVTKVLVAMNSSINPFIYAICNRHFYNEICRIMKTILCCKTYVVKKKVDSIRSKDGKTTNIIVSTSRVPISQQ